MRSISPVFTQEEVRFEREIAKSQKQYSAVIGLPVTLQLVNKETGEIQAISDWGMSIRFRLSREERVAIWKGADLVVTQLLCGKPLSPMNFQLCEPCEKPVFSTDEIQQSNLREMPSAADLDAVAEEQKIADATEGKPFKVDALEQADGCGE